MPLSPARPRLLLAVALMGANAVAWAQPEPQAQQHSPARSHDQQRARTEQQRRHPQPTLSESVRRAERNGQVLSAEQVQSDGRDVNRVKIIDNKGRVRVFWDDATQPQDRRRKNGRSADSGRQDASRTRSDDDGDPTL
jgi:hypothetical protein